MAPTTPFTSVDDVVSRLAEVGYLASDALVDIRASLAAAAEAGIVSLDAAGALVGAAKAIFFKERTYAAVLGEAERCGLTPAAADRLADWLARNAVRQKHADAAALLAALAAGSLPFETPAFRFEPTLLWESWHGEGPGSTGAEP